MPANFNQSTLTVKLLADGQEIDRLTTFLKVSKGFPDPLVAMQEEIFRIKEVGQVVVDLRVDENGTQHGLLRLPIVRNGLAFV
jgi:hypothetical protein